MAKKTIAVLSDSSYRACLPDDPHCTTYYGSEPMHTILADALAKKGYDVHFYAPQGSTPIGTFHPIECSNGAAIYDEFLDRLSLDGSKTTDLLQMDFVIDMTASARCPEILSWYHDYRRYCCYRNGYNAFNNPTNNPRDRHFVVPSKANKEIFEKHGYQADVVYYGIDTNFYNGGASIQYFLPFARKYGLQMKEYFLFPHRPHPDKGIVTLLRLAKDFPQETFMIATATPILEHQLFMHQIKMEVRQKGLQNVVFVDMPLNPKHHYYKRELMRHAKAVLSPFDTANYTEGFGLANAEAISCQTPILVSDSASSRELWIDEKDGLICDGYKAFNMAIKHFSSYNFAPENKFTIEGYVKGYEGIMEKYQ